MTITNEGISYWEKLTPKAIWTVKQNKPSLIAADMAQYGIPYDVTYAVLLGRGVFKWLAVRRDLIRLKNTWKQRVTDTIGQIGPARSEGDMRHLYWLRGYLKAHEECRAELRQLCHSGRFRAPDNDKQAQFFLDNVLNGDANRGEMT